VFHGDCRYITNEEDPRVGYVGGASARGLKKERNRTKTVSAVKHQLARQDVDTVVCFLAYGSVDIDWTVPYKISQGQPPDPETFVEEMCDAWMDLVSELQSLPGATAMNAEGGGDAQEVAGCSSDRCNFLAAGADEYYCCKKCEWGEGHGKRCERLGKDAISPAGRLIVVLTFPYTPVVLSTNYMHDDEHFASLGGTYDITPRADRHGLWMRFVAAMRDRAESCRSGSIRTLDATPVFEDLGTTDEEFRKAFMKEKTGREEGAWNGWTEAWLEDNHPDFIKTQGPIAEYTAALHIPGVEPTPPLTELYPTERRHLAKPFW